MGRLFRLINSQSISMGSLTGLIGIPTCDKDSPTSIQHYLILIELNVPELILGVHLICSCCVVLR